MKTFFEVKTQQELLECFSLLKQLRPKLEMDFYKEIYFMAKKTDEYKLVGFKIGNEVVAVMGYRILYDFVRGGYIYIDDLVVDEKMRSQRLGEELINIAEKKCKEFGFKSIRLCTGLDNEKAMKFYERIGMEKRAVAYVKKI